MRLWFAFGESVRISDLHVTDSQREGERFVF